MNILMWIIFGGLAGWIASLIMGTDNEQGIVANVIVGIIGAFLGGAIMNFFDASGITGFNIRGILIAVLGACAALLIYKLTFK